VEVSGDFPFGFEFISRLWQELVTVSGVVGESGPLDPRLYTLMCLSVPKWLLCRVRR